MLIISNLRVVATKSNQFGTEIAIKQTETNNKPIKTKNIMKKNTNLAILAIAVLDALTNAINDTTSTSTEGTLPTTAPKDNPVRTCVSRETFGEEELVSFLVDECGLKLKSSYADYPPTAKMMAMSTDEVRQIKEYCDSLKEKAEFGDKVMKSVQMLKGLFK